MKLLAGTVLSWTALGSYAFGYAPRFALGFATYRLTLPGWPPELRLKAAIVSDIHACEPWMPLSRIAEIVERTNDLEADIVFLTGDYVAGMASFRTGTIPSPDWARALAGLTAPLGVYAILGNHDW